MSEVLNLMKTRRSIRKFNADAVAKEDLEKIVEAGLFAASGMGKQSPIILAVTDKALRDRLSEMNRAIGGWQEGFDPFYGGPAVLVVLADASVPTCVYDGSLVIGNMLLEAHELGLGSIWVHRAKEEFESEEGKEILRSLGVEGDYVGIGHCVVGHFDGELPAVIARKEGRVFWAE